MKGTIAEGRKEDVAITIVDSKSLSSLAIAGVPPTIPVNAEPFTPTSKALTTRWNFPRRRRR
jgi:hypothetical protein